MGKLNRTLTLILTLTLLGACEQAVDSLLMSTRDGLRLPAAEREAREARVRVRVTVRVRVRARARVRVRVRVRVRA